MFNISEHFLDRIISLGYGERCAIIDAANGNRTTYVELLAEVNSFARSLSHLQLRLLQLNS